MSPPTHEHGADTQRIHLFEESNEQRIARLEQRMGVVEREAAGIADMKTDVAIIKSKLSLITWFVGAACGSLILALAAKMWAVLGI